MSRGTKRLLAVFSVFAVGGLALSISLPKIFDSKAQLKNIATEISKGTASAEQEAKLRKSFDQTVKGYLAEIGADENKELVSKLQKYLPAEASEIHAFDLPRALRLVEIDMGLKAADFLVIKGTQSSPGTKVFPLNGLGVFSDARIINDSGGPVLVLLGKSEGMPPYRPQVKIYALLPDAVNDETGEIVPKIQNEGSARFAKNNKDIVLEIVTAGGKINQQVLQWKDAHYTLANGGKLDASTTAAAEPAPVVNQPAASPVSQSVPAPVSQPVVSKPVQQTVVAPVQTAPVKVAVAPVVVTKPTVQMNRPQAGQSGTQTNKPLVQANKPVVQANVPVTQTNKSQAKSQAIGSLPMQLPAPAIAKSDLSRTQAPKASTKAKNEPVKIQENKYKPEVAKTKADAPKIGSVPSGQSKPVVKTEGPKIGSLPIGATPAKAPVAPVVPAVSSSTKPAVNNVPTKIGAPSTANTPAKIGAPTTANISAKTSAPVANVPAKIGAPAASAPAKIGASAVPTKVATMPKQDASAKIFSQVGSRSINLRSSPSTTAKSISEVSKGAGMEILGKQNGWYKVKHQGKIGYVFAGLVDYKQPDGYTTASVTRNKMVWDSQQKPLQKIQTGDRLVVVGGLENNKYRVQLPNGKTGFVDKDAIDVSIETPQFVP
jgi:hypothetical protein